MMANFIAAQSGNNVGTIGVCGVCQIMPVRVLKNGQGTTADAAAGIAWAADHGAQVINFSASTASPSQLLQDAVEHAHAKGALLIASAGNEASTRRRYPAAFEPALAVTEDDPYHYFPEKNTSTRQWVDINAWGQASVLSKDGQVVLTQGSSVATAVVSGIAALAFAMKPDATATEVNALIRRAADRQPASPAYRTPTVNAAQVMYDLGGTDTNPPAIYKTDLTDNQLVSAGGVYVRPIATDDHGIEHIDLVIDGHVVATVQQPHVSASSTARVPVPAGYNGPLPVTVAAYDYAGNTTAATTTVQVDSTLPTITLISPKPATPMHGDTIDVTVSASDDASSIVADRQGSLPAYSLSAVPGTNLWKGRASVSPEGQIGFGFWDEAGNYDSVVYTLPVDNAPPAGGTITPGAGAKVRGTFVSALGGVTDASGVAKAELWANGRFIGADASAPYSLAVPTGAYSGTLQLIWRVTDGWGQSRTLPARTVIADNKPPTVKITKAPKNKAKVKGTVKVYVSASDNSGIARVELIVNGKVVARDTTAAYVLTVNTKKQKKTMKVQIRVYDRLGNVTYAGARTWHRS
ncbi:hypothetical protein Adi01nite_46320 [Amorphoplanes digitatis]|nr:hypothetical protein Adi01nite_46320 [Actinoplanes digitatis]